MTKKELMVKAHQMTKEIKAEYQKVDYSIQLGLCISFILEEEKEGEKNIMSDREKLLIKKTDLQELNVWIGAYLSDSENLYFKIKGDKGANVKIFKSKKMYTTNFLTLEIENELGNYEVVLKNVLSNTVLNIFPENFGGELKDYKIYDIKLEKQI